MAVIILCLFIAVPWVGLWSLTVTFADNIHLYFYKALQHVPYYITVIDVMKENNTTISKIHINSWWNCKSRG